MKQSVDQIISKAKRFFNKGDYLEARALYLSILKDFPDNRRAQLGFDEANKSIKPEIIKDKFDSLFSAYSQGKFQDVVKQATPFLDIFSQNSDILNLLGSANLMLGDLDLAIKYYREVIRLKPDYAHAYNNLGVAFHNKGNHSEAVIQSKQAIDINPEYAEAYYNLANSLRIQKDFSGAILNFKQALELKDDYVEAYNNLGIVLRVVGELEESVDCLNRALSINPNFRLAHHNLSNTLQDMGDLGLSIESDYNALRINPDYKDVWTSLGFTIKSLQLSGDTDLDLYYERLRTVDVNKTNYNVLQYKLASFQPHLADSSFEHVIKTISANSDDEVTNPQTLDQSSITPSVPDKMIALLHFGRSGTGLFHSLIDNHREISTLPSIYFSEYFDADNWKKLTANGWDQIPESFVRQYEVLFDASSSVPIINANLTIPYIGINEGMANVGENRDEVLTVDRDVFCSELRRLMGSYPKLDPSTFFTLVHVAYEAALNNPSDKHTIFYHIHNPSDYTKLNFLRYRPDARFIMMVREPIQSCESWLRECVDTGDFKKLSSRIIQMLFDIDQIAFRKCDSVGVRLEDLKLHPHETISSLCDWMGIKEEPGLYEMTAQGQKWWGDPSSVDYSEAGMSPFDDKSIKRQIGSIFSDRDQFILRTFFYPFSVRFGYIDEDLSGFRRDLTEVKPMLEELFDFEKQIASDREIDLDMYKKSVSYLYLRAGLLDRWKVLNEFSDYPHLLTPLKIELDT